MESANRDGDEERLGMARDIEEMMARLSTAEEAAARETAAAQVCTHSPSPLDTLYLTACSLDTFTTSSRCQVLDCLLTLHL
jgi:hypothetical protein